MMGHSDTLKTDLLIMNVPMKCNFGGQKSDNMNRQRDCTNYTVRILYVGDTIGICRLG
jgi:hypothetical protein